MRPATNSRSSRPGSTGSRSNQNGAPLRLVTPWKYGFKGIKSIVRVDFTVKEPVNSWQRLAQNEYGFYAT